jgi:cytoskeletal protein CcmA (bactofilin family)
MFGRNAQSEIDTLVGMSARIEGNVSFSGGLRIDGEVRGNVIAVDGADSLLIVSEHARIEGEVRCANMVVNGHICGPVVASELLEVQPKGSIVGNVHYKRIELHGGASVSGQMTPLHAGDSVFHLALAEERCPKRELRQQSIMNPIVSK